MKIKKFLCSLMAIGMMVSAVSVNAFASFTQPGQVPMWVNPNYTPEYVDGFASQADELAEHGGVSTFLFESSTCMVPYNSGSGTTGKIAVEFVADSSKAEFTLDTKYDGSYHCQLYRVITNSETPVGTEVISSFGYGPTFKNLVEGATYRIKISSTDVPAKGTTGDYTLDTD